MRQREFIQLISGQRPGAWAGLLRLLLRLFSFWYWLAVVARLGLYRVGLLRGVKVKVPVICVGNLTTGGTGKTPAVAWMVKALQVQALKPCIVSRGYRSDDSGNDELKVLEELCPGVPHVQDPDRVAAADKAIEQGAQAIVLDDGFSHLRLKRDLDVLLLDSLNPFGYGRMLPRGLMREPLRSVRRAGFVVFTRADAATPERLRDLEDTVRCYGFTGGIAHAAHTPVRLARISNGEEAPLALLKGAVVAPFCGIGHPRGFERTLEGLGSTLGAMGAYHLDDHAQIGEAELRRQVVPFLRAAREAGAGIAVCTQKDAVKFRGVNLEEEAGMPIYELRVEFRVTHNEDGLRHSLREAIEKS